MEYYSFSFFPFTLLYDGIVRNLSTDVVDIQHQLNLENRIGYILGVSIRARRVQHFLDPDPID
jgi:hypothetical protein